MESKIVIQRKGGKEGNLYLSAAWELKDELEQADIELQERFEKAWQPLCEFLIQFSSTVAAVYVVKFIDHILKKKKENPNDGVSITVIDQSVNISFHLPEEREKAIEYFKKKDTQ